MTLSDTVKSVFHDSLYLSFLLVKHIDLKSWYIWKICCGAYHTTSVFNVRLVCWRRFLLQLGVLFVFKNIMFAFSKTSKMQFLHKCKIVHLEISFGTNKSSYDDKSTKCWKLEAFSWTFTMSPCPPIHSRHEPAEVDETLAKSQEKELLETTASTTLSSANL